MTFDKIKKVLSVITSPKQAINMMLEKLPQDKAEMLKTAINSNNFKGALEEGIKSGAINKQNFNKAKSMYNKARKFGLIKQKISDDEWNKFEKLIPNQSSNSVGFKRF